MSCGLKSTLGVEAPCDGSACVFWRHADGESGMREGCVLNHYQLTGTIADQTTRWLYDYKLSTERSRLAAYLHSVHSPHIVTSRKSAAIGVA